ncbi:chorismate synthase [uncultured Megasphaera sp.]|uniref:chorismate synthase n=1 Tax=uncultured Megasphaera sp. TaxID=165188 RepID=UPI00280649D3|nr:chorismate synthase [uncultured Megasphaera sp.]
MTVKNRVLLGLALICGVLSLCFWPEREEDAFSSDVFRQAEEVTAAETEMMAPDEVLQSAKGDVHLQALYNKRPVCLFFWASWSSGSLRQLEVLESLYGQYGQDIYFRVAFKPVATVLMEQPTVDIYGNETILKARGRHDPCVLPRAVPIVEAMAAMTILDYYLLNKTTHL